MKPKKLANNILEDEIDEDILSRLPEWFRIVRKKHSVRSQKDD